MDITEYSFEAKAKCLQPIKVDVNHDFHAHLIDAIKNVHYTGLFRLVIGLRFS